MRAVRFFDGALSLTLILASRWIRSSLAGRVQCREHHCGGGLVGAQQNHQHVDEGSTSCRSDVPSVRERGGNRSGEHVKVRLGGSLPTYMAKCPHLQAGQFDRTPSSPRKYIERYSSRLGECCSAITTGKMALSGYFLAAVPLFSTTSCHTRASWHSVGTRVNFYVQFKM